MISKELKSQLSILKETNPEYIQTLKDAVMASFKAELQAIKPSSTEEEEQLNIELKDIVLKILFGPFYNYFVSEYVVSDTIWEEQDKLIEDQGYESGISMYGHYIACKCLDISSEKEYMNQLTDITIIDIISLP